jgi:hypothetical protein
MDKNYYDSEHDIEIDFEFAQMASMTDDELMLNYFDIIKKEIYKKRNMILLPDAAERLKHVVSLIKTLQHNSSITDYEITTDVFKLNPTELLILLETSFFGVGPGKIWIWEELMQSIIAFSVEPAPDGRFRFVFSMKDMLQEIEEDIENDSKEVLPGDEINKTSHELEKMPEYDHPVYEKLADATNDFIGSVNSMDITAENDTKNELKSNLRSFNGSKAKSAF